MDFSNNTVQVIVIGGGLMGSAAAWQLAQQGIHVVLLEQQDEIYATGSSFGEARISRSLGPKNDIFSYLQQFGITETEKLIEFLNDRDNGVHKMEDIYSTSPVTYIYYKNQQTIFDELLEQQADPIEYASSPNSAKQLFGVNANPDMRIIREYKKYSGTMNPKVLLQKLHRAIELKNSEVKYNTEVTDLIKENDVYKIKFRNLKTGVSSTITSHKVISAAGAYTGKLLQKIAPYFNQLINPQRVSLTHFKVSANKFERLSDAEKKHLLDAYPVADFTSDVMFSMIEKVDSDGIPIIKIGGHLRRSDILDMNKVWDKKLTSEESKWSLETTSRYLQFLNLPIGSDDLILVNSYSCVYSLTRSEVPLVTNVLADDGISPDPNFVVIAGMSGVGAKGTLAYGKIGADLILKSDSYSSMYEKTKKALGFERLPNDAMSLKDFGVQIFGH